MLGIKDNAAFLPVGVRQALLGLVLCINWNLKLKRMGTSRHASTNELAARFPYYVIGAGSIMRVQGVVALVFHPIFHSFIAHRAGFIIHNFVRISISMPSEPLTLFYLVYLCVLSGRYSSISPNVTVEGWPGLPGQPWRRIPITYRTISLPELLQHQSMIFCLI